MKKLYIIRKYIFAESIKEALRKDKTESPDDIYLDEGYRQMNLQQEDTKKIDFNK